MLLTIYLTISVLTFLAFMIPGGLKEDISDLVENQDDSYSRFYTAFTYVSFVVCLGLEWPLLAVGFMVEIIKAIKEQLKEESE